jgi:hypothetical protein
MACSTKKKGQDQLSMIKQVRDDSIRDIKLT